MNTSLNITNDDLILIVAPHPDDESIGMGGFLSIYGKQCDILYVTDGSRGISTNVDCSKITETRFKEAQKLIKKAQVHDAVFLNIEDRKAFIDRRIIYKFDIRKYNYIFIPNRNDEHIDHAIMYPVFSKMMRKQRSKAILVEYETWTPLITVTNVIDINDAIDKKISLINCYKSQLMNLDYVSKSISLNAYRGADINKKYVEAYYVSNKKLFSRINYYIPRSIKYAIRILLKTKK